jgi:hypothetical protein
MRFMRSTAFVLLFCAGLMVAGCDDKPRPGAPVPKALAAGALTAPQH